MAVETLTLTLGVDDNDGKFEGDKLIVGDKNDNQNVTIEDGGDFKSEVLIANFGKGTATEAGAGAGGDDNFYIDLSGFNDDFNITLKSMDPGDNFVFTGFDSYTTVGTVWTFQYTGTDGAQHKVSIDAEADNGTGVANIVVCFVRGSRILTPTGERPIEQLQCDDVVVCGDGVARRVRWVGCSHLDQANLRAHPELNPVRLAADSLGPGCPEQELHLSPQHRVLLRDWRAELLFGEREVLVPAVSLLNDKSISQPAVRSDVDYFHILLEGHHTVWANGVECETLMPAAMAQASLSGAARDEILQIFPDIASDIGAFGDLCHPVLKKHETRVMPRY